MSFFNGFHKMIVLVAMMPACGMAQASAVYIAQTAAGAGDGSSCANAHAVTFFNLAANWGNGSTQIGPGTTAHLCGTFTAPAGASGYLTFRGSGSSGSPITLYFETSAILQAPYWGTNGAIYVPSQSYITIDGGTSGLIQATLNGTAGGSCVGGTCTNQVFDGEGVYLTNTSNIEVKNLTIGNLYNHTSISDTGGDGAHHPWAVSMYGGNTSITIDNNTFHDMNWCVMIQSFGAPSGPLDVHSNNIYNVSVGVVGGDGNAGSTINGPVNVYNNTIHDMQNWDANGDVNHHDGVYIYITNSTSSFTGAYNVYNNLIYNLGTTCTTAVYFDSGATAIYPSGHAFNNVISGISGCGDGAFFDKSGKGQWYNNTLADPQGVIVSVAGAGVSVIENNISQATEGILFSTAALATSDYNDWYNLHNPAFTYSAVGFSTLAASRTATGFDTHSITSSPSLNSNYVPNPGSPVIGAGINLYSVCNGQPNPGLGALCSDKAGNARPASGGWDIGAYIRPVPPTSLTLRVQ